MSWKHRGKIIETDKELRLTGGGVVSRAPYIFDHFATGAGALNSAVPQHWVTTQAGSGTLHVSNATAGSYAVGASGGTTDNAIELAGKKVGWNCSTQSGLVLEVRAKFVGTTTALDGDFLIGFGDAVTQASSLAYVVSAASAVTTGAPTEFCGFFYSSVPTSGALYVASGNMIGMVTTISGVDTITASSPVTIKDSSFHIFRINLDTSANAQFYIDDVWVGSVAAAYTANTEMTPYIAAVAKASHVNTNSVDYIHVGAGAYV